MPRSLSSLKKVLGQVPARPANLEVLEACTLLNGIEPQERAVLAEVSFMAYAERGEVIWLAGSPSEFVAIVGTGFVKMTKTTPGGQEVAVELLGPGQCFGLIAAIEGRAFPLSAVAVSHTWYLKVPTRAVKELYEGSRALKDQVVRIIGPRLRKAHDMMARLSSGKVEERIAAVLFILADSYGENAPDGVRLAVPLTRQDIAEMAGTTVETAIRVMSRWQKRNLIATDNQIITILDLDSVLEVFRG